ncbi:adhesion G-protein coupled receptor D1-like isoform X3 [Mercenaria mercenaria]|uniref:adhesion G-protein coupled receptor D1-like isoform X3 n=1 Tax=Mercenaria mercenaria TaxID=6596 RepID=UPI00234EF641|nr:adhesion G-protein coupled receptor D1-like isoform X3 [Mercenaria mercenaria]
MTSKDSAIINVKVKVTAYKIIQLPLTGHHLVHMGFINRSCRTSFRSLCVLVPVLGLSWILGIFYMNDSFYFVQYIFAILNGLQGFFIFLFHCLLNPQVKKALMLRQRRRSSAKETLKSTDILQPQFSQQEVKFSTPLGLYGNGRRAATFNAESHESYSVRSQNLSDQLQRNILSARL